MTTLVSWVRRWHPGQLVVALAVLLVIGAWSHVRATAAEQRQGLPQAGWDYLARADWADTLVGDASAFDTVAAQNPFADFVVHPAKNYRGPDGREYTFAMLRDSVPEWRRVAVEARASMREARWTGGMFVALRTTMMLAGVAILWTWFGARPRT